MRYFFFVMMFGGLFHLSLSQVSLPAEHGGSRSRQLDIRNLASFFRYDFVKFHPDYTKSTLVERKCATVEMESLRKQFAAGENNTDFEKWIMRTIELTEGDIQKDITLTIPVVVHVIYSNQVENIPKEQILSQIQILNADYQRLNHDTILTSSIFEPVSANIGIKFELASRTPYDQPTDGIDRVSMAGSPFAEKYVNEIIKPNTIWDPHAYLNLWVCNLGTSVLGFSQFPESSGLSGIPVDVGGENTDGVVIHYGAFGGIGALTPPFHKGRTATHEIGHWLGLRHIWGDGDCDADDFCDDTPNTNAPNSGCGYGRMGCTQRAMVENFMDYTNDSCMNTFTLDQKKRIRAVLETSPRRKTLPFSKALNPLEQAPTPTFVADIKMIVAGGEVNFEDRTQGDLRDRKWAFPGGSPPNASEKKATITYNKAGSYPVSLSLTNEFGVESRTVGDYIHVFDKGMPLPISIDFEQDFATLQKRKLFFPQQGQWQWLPNKGGHGQSAGAIWVNNYSENKLGAKSVFFLPPLDFTTGLEAQLQFDLSYKHYNDFYGDTLAIYISTDAGKNFHAIYYKHGEKLSRNQSTESAFVALPQDWITEKIDLTAYDKEKQVMICFVNYSGYGNNLFLDNIKVSSAPLPLPEIDFVADKREACAGESIRFTDKSRYNPQNWLWSFPGAVITADSSENPSIIYENPGLFDVLLTTRNSAGETSGVKKGYITIKPKPSIQITGNLNPICPQTPVSLRATGANEITWESQERKYKGELLSDTLHATTTFVVKGKGGNGCLSTETVTVSVKDAQEVKVIPQAAHICQGEAVNLRVIGGKTCLWQGKGLSVNALNAPSQTVAPLNHEVYQVEIQTESGCQFKKNIPVSVHPHPVLSIHAPKKTVCLGEQMTLEAKGALHYYWTNENILGGQLPISPLKTNTYQVVGINEYGCSDSAVQEISVESPPQISVSPSVQKVCEGTSLTLQAQGAASYQWLSEDKKENHSNGKVSLTPTESQSYRLVGTSQSGCKDTLDIPIVVLPTPRIIVEADNYAVCKGESILLTAKGGNAYSWETADGSQKWTGNRITDTPKRTTIYKVSARDENNCTSAPVEIEIQAISNTPAKADFMLLNKGKICAHQPVRLSSTGSPAQKYYWEFPGGEPAFSTLPNPEVVYKSGGVYSVYLKVEGCNGVDEVLKKDFFVIEEVPSVQILTDKENICVGETIQLRAQTENASEIRWMAADYMEVSKSITFTPQQTTDFLIGTQFTNGCQSETHYTLALLNVVEKILVTPENPTVCKGDSIKLFIQNALFPTWKTADNTQVQRGNSFWFAPNSSQNIEVTAKNTAGCTVKKTVPIKVLPKPEVEVTPNIVLLCKGSSASLVASGATIYQWSPEIGLSNFAGKTVEASPPLTQSYWVKGTNEYGCSATAPVTIGVSDMPPLEVRVDDKEICKGNATRIHADGGESYHWSPNFGITENEGNSIVVSPAHTTTYKVESVGVDGCNSSKLVTIKVNDFEPLAVLPQSPVICAGDSVLLEANTPYRVRWGEGVPIRVAAEKKVWVTPTASRMYHVHAWDENGCNRSGFVNVIVKQNLHARITVPSTWVCEGESLTLQASGGKEYQWISSQGASYQSGDKIVVSPEKKEKYRVVVKDKEGCRDTAQFEISARWIVPKMNISQWEIDLANEKGVVEFRDTTLFATQWRWDFGDGGTSTQKNTKHLYVKPGNYTVTLYASNGVCEKSTTQVVRILDSSNLTGLDKTLTLQPTSDLLMIAFQIPSDMSFQASLWDKNQEEIMSGIIRAKKGKNKHEMDISALPKGIYTLKISTTTQTISRKIEKI